MNKRTLREMRKFIRIVGPIALFALALALLTTFLSGCPWNVTPTTESQCQSRPNCGQCASEAVCVWNVELARCEGVSEPRGSAPVANTTEECNALLEEGVTVR